MDNFSIVMGIYSIKENGRTIIFKEKENYIIIPEVKTGINMKVNLDQVQKTDSGSFFSEMEIDTRDNLETIYFGEKEDYSIKIPIF